MKWQVLCAGMQAAACSGARAYATRVSGTPFSPCCRLGLFKKRRNEAGEDRGAASSSSEEEQGKEPVPSESGKRTRRSNQGIKDKCIGRPSLDLWFEARKARTYIHDSKTTTTTEHLQVLKVD
jgi:hypothetical protein